MNKLVISFLVGSFALSTGITHAQELTKIAVANLSAEEGVTDAMARTMTGLLRTALYKTGRFDVMNREDMGQLLKGIDLAQDEGCNSVTCAVELGKALGVSKMVAGSIGILGTNYVINAKLIDVEKFQNEILVTEFLSRSSNKKPTGVIRKIARQLAGTTTIRRKKKKKTPIPVVEKDLEPRIDIAVVNLEAKGEMNQGLAVLLTDILRTEMYATGRYNVMNREDMNIILKELAFQQSGACLEASCVVEMGQALGVDKMVSGTMGVVGGNIVINAKVLDVRSSKADVLVTEYLARKDLINPKPVFQNVALQLAGLDPIIFDDFKPVDVFVTGGIDFISAEVMNIGPKTKAQGLVSFSMDLQVETTTVASFAMGAGIRYKPNSWMAIGLEYDAYTIGVDYSVDIVFEPGAQSCGSTSLGNMTMFFEGNHYLLDVNFMKKISASSTVLAGLGLSLYSLGFETNSGFCGNMISGPESVEISGSIPQNRVSGMADGDGHYLRPFVQIGFKQKIKRRLALGFTLRYYPIKTDTEIYIPVSITHRGGLGIISVINEDIEIGRLVFHDIGLRSTVSLSF